MQLSAKLRKAAGGHSHWCPGCEEMHMIPDSWNFNGDVDRPTFTPSVKITSYDRHLTGKRELYVCHYHIHDGQISFEGDSTHNLRGQRMELPDLPEGLRDAF